MLKKFLFPALLTAAILLGAAPASWATTTVTGSITSNSTWTLAGSPYYLPSGVTVSAGVSLNIDPGVVVKFGNSSVLTVKGTVNANGTADNRVYFTDYRDDGVGGDTNGDGSATLPAPGGWGGINVYSGGSATLANATVRYGGPLYQTGTGNLTLTNCTVSDSKSFGIDTENSSGFLTVTNSTFKNNASYGIRLWSMTGPVTVSGSSLDRVYLNASNLAGFSGNSCSGYIQIHAGAVTQDTTLDPTVTYYVEWTFGVNSGATLTVPAGTVVKLNGSVINVYGNLYANGTGANPVHFTDYRDDSLGGDTNGDGSATLPAPGGWAGINVYGGGNAAFANTTVRYGGPLYQTGNGNLTLTNCTVSDSSTYGVHTESATGSLTVTNSTFGNNASEGIHIWSMTGPVTVSGNSLDRVYLNASNLAGFSGNNCSGYIEISGGTIAKNTSLEGGTTYVVDSGVTDQATITLTIPAGTVVKLKTGVVIAINGSLSATGTAASPVYFTDYRDDSVRGDTNGDGGATPPAPGGWGGIAVANGASASFAYTTIRYGGSVNAAELYKTGSGTLTVANSTVSDSSSSGIRIYSSSGTYSIANSTVRDNASYGIYLISSAATGTVSGNTIRNNTRGISVSGTVTNPKVSQNTLVGNGVGVYCENSAAPLIGGTTADGNNFLHNTSYGVQNSSSATVQATYNWWGAASGPRYPSNPLGTGDAVSDNVAFGNLAHLPAAPIAIGTYTPSQNYFQHVSVGRSSASQTFSVLNSGNQPLVLGTVALVGDNPGDFTIHSDTCSGKTLPAAGATPPDGGAPLPAGECSVSVVFAPTAPTANTQSFRTAHLLFPSNDVYPAGASVDLSGYGAPPLASLPFQDDFVNGYSNYWAMPDLNSTTFSFSENPGNLRIYSSNSDLADSAANVLILPIPSGIGRMMVTARVGFPTLPSGETQQGGIALMAEQTWAADFGNLVTASYGFSGGAPSAQSTAVVGGTTSLTATSPANLNSVLLRVIRRGSSYQSLYSTDEGATYIPLGTSSATWDAGFLALFALNGAGSTAPSLPVDFDSVKVELLPLIGVTAAVDFGTVSYQSAPAPQRNVTLTNSGSGDLVISSLAVSGTDSTLFLQGPGNCGPLPITIPPQGSCNLTVTLATYSLGAKAATLAIDSNDIDHQEVLVPLNCTLVDTTPPSVTFSVPPYSNSLTVPLTLGATDNVGVVGYLVSESPTTPQALGSGWAASPATVYRFDSTGEKYLYAWAKDAAGNVSLLRGATVTVDIQPPVLGSFTATVKGTSTTAVLSGVGATDDLSAVQYAISASPTVPTGGWSATAPATYGPIAPGTTTLYAFAKDAAGNVATPVAAQIRYVWGVSVQMSGTGGGAVHSAPSAIACVSGSTSGCSADFDAGSGVSLAATPDANSTFDGWGGNCSNAGDCKLTMDADKALTAIFTLAPLVKMGGAPYATLQDAYDHAADGAVIYLKEGVLPGAFAAGNAISVTVVGGYDAAYSVAAGQTAIAGQIVLKGGTVRMRGVGTK